MLLPRTWTSTWIWLECDGWLGWLAGWLDVIPPPKIWNKVQTNQKIEKKTFKTSPQYLMKDGERPWSKTIQGGEFSTSSSLLWITQSISLNIPSYVPLYEIYNHYSINCFASLSEENCAKIISPDECSGTKGSEKIAGHYFFHDTEFQMPKLNTGIIKAFLTYLPFTEKNILQGLQYKLYLKIFKDQEKSCYSNLTCIHLSSEKINNTVTGRVNSQLNGCTWLEQHFSMQRKKNTLVKYNIEIQAVNIKYITLHQSTKQYAGCPCRSHYQLLRFLVFTVEFFITYMHHLHCKYISRENFINLKT